MLFNYYLHLFPVIKILN